VARRLYPKNAIFLFLGYHLHMLNDIPNPRFIGRKAEMARLNDFLSKRSARLIVVRGRRRIGKSRLLKEFSRQMKSFTFSGLPPKPKQRTKSLSQRKEFVSQMEQQGIPGIKPDDWSNLFWHLAQHSRKGRVLIILDEISWMGNKDPDFLGKLKNAWDLHFSNNPELILILCGSISSWIEENILSPTGYLGRVSLDLCLDELSINECDDFWEPYSDRLSSFEKFKILSVTGGVPLYLELIWPELSAEENIRQLCFMRGGFLVREFKQFFSDLFSRRSKLYQEIVECLTDGPKTLTQIREMLGKNRGGVYSTYLDNLVKASYVKRDFTWNFDTTKLGKQTKFRLSDNYLRFYLKYIAPQLMQIENGFYSYPSLSTLPAWETIMGLQFENLVVHNRQSIWKILRIDPSDIIMEGPFFQRHTKAQSGCQIDYLIQTRFHTIYLIEIKFSKNLIGTTVIEEVEQKRQKLIVPKYCSIRPVLIHVNGIEENVKDTRYFNQIIDFGELLD
jgi:hypothetical protein